jgi:hypothetical protein
MFVFCAAKWRLKGEGLLHIRLCVDRCRAKRNEKEAQEQVRSKELVIVDLTKKCTDLNNRLKEFSALYDIVKNERNKYVNQIQVRQSTKRQPPHGGLIEAGLATSLHMLLCVARVCGAPG